MGSHFLSGLTFWENGFVLFGKLAALSPFELASITYQIKSVTDMIRKPVTYITGHYLMKIFLHNPMYFISCISGGNMTVIATIKGGEEALKERLKSEHEAALRRMEEDMAALKREELEKMTAINEANMKTF